MSNIQIPELANMRCNTSGIDSLKLCDNKQHFNNYKKQVNYVYNSRGFRDDEWPNDLNDCIWCIGDSFTAGLGQPQDETWPSILRKFTNKRTINVSMDGASNEWCNRIASAIIKNYKANIIIVQWSFISRRELNDSNLSDLKRRVWCNSSDLKNSNEISVLKNNIINTINCINDLENKALHTTLIHTFVPNFDRTGYIFPDNSTHIWEYAREKLNFDINNTLSILDNEQIDYSRDGFHYDIQTSTKFVKNILPILKNKCLI